MIRIAFLFVALLWSGPASAACFLFFCPPRHHHHAPRHHHHHHHLRPRIVHKTVVKKVTIVRERKVPAAAVDITPITPLK